VVFILLPEAKTYLMGELFWITVSNELFPLRGCMAEQVCNQPSFSCVMQWYLVRCFVCVFSRWENMQLGGWWQLGNLHEAKHLKKMMPHSHLREQSNGGIWTRHSLKLSFCLKFSLSNLCKPENEKRHHYWLRHLLTCPYDRFAKNCPAKFSHHCKERVTLGGR
jgi:hypothetical protein